MRLLARARRRSLPAGCRAVLIFLSALGGCGREEVLHGLDERQANQVLVALDDEGIGAEKRRDEGAEGRWRVEVASADAARSHRLLAERELARPEPAGFAAVYGKGSVVPTPAEDRARLLQALAGELSRSLEAVDGVQEARVHVALPPDEPLRGGPPAAPRGSVLARARAGARGRVEAQVAGIQALVAGAVPGLEPAQVAVVVTESSPAAQRRPERRSFRTLLLGLAAAALSLALWLLAPRLRALPIPWARLRRGA